MTQTPVPDRSDAATVRIERLGVQGDGVADTPDGAVFVPYTLPGERVVVERRGAKARLVKVIEASPERRAPACPHFGVCGGCVLQHMDLARYRVFKQALVEEALRQRGVAAEVSMGVGAGLRSRRRAVVAAGWSRGALRIGFHGLRSHEIHNITACPILTPRLEALLPRLEPIARIAAPRKGALQLTATDTPGGVDLAISGSGKLDADARIALSLAAEPAGITRLSLEGEVLIAHGAPKVRFGRALVTPPPGGFLQAVESCEAEMAAIALGAAEGAASALDLFAGSGAFALRLAEHMRVHAVESDAGAVAAMTAAARGTPDLKPLTTEVRDLFRRPLHPSDLNRHDVVVLDPPRAGADAQAAHLAGSKVRSVIYASCNPVTLARDLRTLLDGGYRIERVTAIDQFLFSAHVEVVTVLRKD
ncbi:hypothetical protein GC169_05300 [bacterium]|nr:hypothetical protein [bacterium]